jgi:hypothetical protein
LRLRSPAKPSPAKPRANIAQVDGSGTAEAEALPLKLALKCGKPNAAQLGLRRSRLSRSKHVSNAAGAAEQDERDDDGPCDLKGAASTR